MASTERLPATERPGPDERAGGRLRMARFEVLYLGVFAVVLGCLAYFFPRSGDDWAWGSSIGTSRLDSFFRDYNGRYAGNLFILVLMRATYLIPVFEAALVALTLWLLLDLVAARRPLGYATATVLFMAMPIGNWRQVMQWVSGFSNYAPAAIGALVFLRAVKADWLGRLSRERQWLRCAGVVVFGFVFALFMENVTLYLVLASVVYVIWYRIARRRFSVDSLAWALGFIAGAAAMFSNGAYRKAASGEGLHHAAQVGTHAKFLKLVGPVSDFTVTANTALNIAFALTLLLAVVVHGRRIGALWSAAIAVSTLAFVAADLIVRGGRAHAHHVSFSGAEAGFLALALVLVAVKVVQDRFLRAQILIAIVSVVVLIAPLVTVDPIGPRQFYVTYLLLMGVVLALLRVVVPDPLPRPALVLAPTLAAIAAVVMAWDFHVYVDIHQHADTRLDHLRAKAAQGQRSLVVRPLPYTEYVHNGDPRGTTWQYRYKLYYHLPMDLTITVRPAKSK